MPTIEEIVKQFVADIVQAVAVKERERILSALDGNGITQKAVASSARKRPAPPVEQIESKEVTTEVVSAPKKTQVVDSNPPRLQTVERAGSKNGTNARKLQGTYMGNMRALSPKAIELVKAERNRNGIEAAIKLAESFKMQDR